MKVVNPRTLKRLERNRAAIIALNRATKATKMLMLDAASKDLVLALVEIAQNIISGNVPLNPQQLKQLRRHQQDLQMLVKPKTTIINRKRILQKGGFLPLILGPLIGAVGSALGGLFGGRK